MKCSKHGCLNPAKRMTVVKNLVSGQKISQRYCMEHVHLSRHCIPVFYLVCEATFTRLTYTLSGLEVHVYDIGEYE